MNHVINSILENASTRSSIGHTNPALLHDVLWRALEHALKANTDDASQTPHSRACLRIYAEIDTLSYLDKAACSTCGLASRQRSTARKRT